MNVELGNAGHGGLVGAPFDSAPTVVAYSYVAGDHSLTNGAPADLAVAGTYAGLGLAGVHGLGYATTALVAGVAPVAATCCSCSLTHSHTGCWSDHRSPARPCGHQAGAPQPNQICVRICHQDPQASHPSSSHRCPNCPQGNSDCQRPIIKIRQ